MHLLLTPARFGSAWANASYAGDAASYDFAKDYGPHDWIAEAALNALATGNASGWKWLADRETIFLVGTEAPDNSAVAMTLDGVTVSGFGDTTHHHIYFDDSRGTVTDDSSAVRAKWCGDQANLNYEGNQLDLAAFYLGAMTPNIADMGVYAHVAENNVPPYDVNFDLHHSDLESYVKTRTNDYANPQSFFTITTFTPGSKTPYNAAKDLAWDTYKDPTATGIPHNAIWLHKNFFSGWVSSYADRATDTVAHQEYYTRIEQNLKNAIQVNAAAMNNVIGLTSPTSSSSGSSDPSGNNRTSGFSLAGYPAPILAAIAIFMVVWIEGRLARKIKSVTRA